MYERYLSPSVGAGAPANPRLPAGAHHPARGRRCRTPAGRRSQPRALPLVRRPRAAAYLEMSPDAVRKAALRGLLPAHQPSGRAPATSSTAESSTSTSWVQTRGVRARPGAPADGSESHPGQGRAQPLPARRRPLRRRVHGRGQLADKVLPARTKREAKLELAALQAALPRSCSCERRVERTSAERVRGRSRVPAALPGPCRGERTGCSGARCPRRRGALQRAGRRTASRPVAPAFPSRGPTRGSTRSAQPASPGRSRRLAGRAQARDPITTPRPAESVIEA